MVVPHPITDLFALNNERHNYNTRQTHDLQIMQEGVKLFISFLAVMGCIIIWIHISKKNPIDVSHVCFKNLTKTYLQTNDILYRVR